MVEKILLDNKFRLAQEDIDEYQVCRVIASPEVSDFSSGDTILIANRICFEKAPQFGVDKYYISGDEVFGILKDGVITALKNIVYIKADKYEKTSIDIGGIKFHNDTSYKPLARKNVTQSGVVLTACKTAKHSAFNHELKVEVSAGDKVYCHHFLTDSDNERKINGETYYEFQYEHLYCKLVDEKLVMLNDWNFVSPIESSEDLVDNGIIMELKKKNELRVGVINHSSASLKAMGISDGDKVYFKKGREYSMDVEDETFYRIETRDILCKYRKMEALGEIVVVKAIKESNMKGGMIYSLEQNPIPEKGEVLAVGPNCGGGLKPGDVVLFRKMASSEVEIEGQKVLLMSYSNIYVKV